MRKTLFLISVIIVITFIFSLLTGDFSVFWSYSRQIEQIPLYGLEKFSAVWEIKGILFRMWVFLLYSLTSLFYPDYSLQCQFLYKLFGFVLLLIPITLTIKLIPSNYIKKKNLALSSLIIILFGVHFSSHLQPEMIAVVVLLLATSLLLRNSKTSLFVAAMFYSSTIFLKTPLPLMGGSLILAISIIEKKSIVSTIKRIIPFFVFSILTWIGSFYVLYVTVPQEISDIYNASYYQDTLLHGGPTGYIWASISFFKKMPAMLVYIPTLLLTIFSLLGIIKQKRTDGKTLFKICLLWLFPFIYIIISNKFFVYHFYLLLYPAIITIYYYLTNTGIRLSKRIEYPAFAICLAIFILFASGFSYNIIYQEIDYAHKYDSLKAKGYMTNCYLGDGAILQLNAGQGSLLFKNKSYSRYFYPLPIQRINERSSRAQLDFFKKTKKEFLDYDGDYIILDKTWFFRYEHPEIERKIETDYITIDSISIPTTSWNINFSKDSRDGKLLLLKKKGLQDEKDN